jgi:3-oxoacyl-(acyl-carrier-protein) synthase
VIGASVLSWSLRTSLGTTIDEVLARVLAGERGAGGARGLAEGSRHDRFLPRLPLLALEAAHEAARAAGITGGDRVGVFAGVGGLRVSWSELAPVLHEQRDDGAGAWARGLCRMHPFWMLRNLSNNGHALLAADLAARGEGATFGGATAGVQAIASAVRSLAAETIDVAIVVAYDTLLAPAVGADVHVSGVPYGEETGGLAPGEAAAALVLARGGRAIARIQAASTADGEPDEPLAQTLARAAARVVDRERRAGPIVIDGAARARAGLDHAEREALATLVEVRTPLVATAGAFGALGAATGLVQAIVMGELLRRGVLPPIAALARPALGPFRPILAAEAAQTRLAVCLSTGAPGLAAALAVEAVA